MAHNKDEGYRPLDYYPNGNKFTSKIGVTSAAKQWSGYGTSLKPAFEPIILAQKSIEGTYASNAQNWGVAGLNIDAGRIAIDENIDDPRLGGRGSRRSDKAGKYVYNIQGFGKEVTSSKLGRWPSNIILSHSPNCINIEANDIWACVPDCPIRIMDSQSGQSKSTKLKHLPREAKRHRQALQLNKDGAKWIDGMGGASRFFYCAKASRNEREEGLKEVMPCIKCSQINTNIHTINGTKESCIRNNHPTVKPLDLMEYLCKLIQMPERQDDERLQVILDPFCGSGTTLLAAQKMGIKYIGIDQDMNHVLISSARSIKPKFEDVEPEIELPNAETLSSSDFEDLLI